MTRVKYNCFMYIIMIYIYICICAQVVCSVYMRCRTCVHAVTTPAAVFSAGFSALA